MTIDVSPCQRLCSDYARKLQLAESALQGIGGFTGEKWSAGCCELAERYPAGLFFHALTLYAVDRARWWRFPRRAASPRPIRRIAVVCDRLHTGGAERCAALLLKHWSEEGFAAALFTAEEADARDYPLPGNVPRRTCSRFEPLMRLAETRIFLEEFAPDLCVTIDHHDPWALAALLEANALGIRTAAMEHSAFSYILYGGEPELFFRRQAVYSVCDAVTCLSRPDELMLRSWGLEACYMPNPPTYEPGDFAGITRNSEENILFAGRLTADKGASAALAVLSEVRRRHPRAKLLLAGTFVHPNYAERFHAEAAALGVGDAIEELGFVADMRSVFARTAVHIMPSAVEGFPMALMEAKAAGVPSVLFDMPYLEAAKPEYGCLQAGKDDPAGMARMIAELFDDREKLAALGKAARNSLSHFSNDAVFDRWNRLFAGFASGEAPRALFPEEASTEEKLAWSLMESREFFYGLDHCLRDPVFVMRDRKAVLRRYLDEDAVAFAASKVSAVLNEFFPKKSRRRTLLNISIMILFYPFQLLFRMLRRCYRLFRPFREPEEHIC